MSYKISLVAKIEKVCNGKTRSVLSSSFHKELDDTRSLELIEFFESKGERILSTVQEVVENECAGVDATNSDRHTWDKENQILVAAYQNKGKYKKGATKK